MALFSFKKEKKAEKEQIQPKMEISRRAPSSAMLLSRGRALFPRITEKATMQAERNVYVFTVDMDATKNEIMKLVELFYKVRPVKVSILPIRSKQVVRRGIRGRTARAKKAYVFLKKGETITLA